MAAPNQGACKWGGKHLFWVQVCTPTHGCTLTAFTRLLTHNPALCLTFLCTGFFCIPGINLLLAHVKWIFLPKAVTNQPLRSSVWICVAAVFYETGLDHSTGGCCSSAQSHCFPGPHCQTTALPPDWQSVRRPDVESPVTFALSITVWICVIEKKHCVACNTTCTKKCCMSVVWKSFECWTNTVHCMIDGRKKKQSP